MGQQLSRVAALVGDWFAACVKVPGVGGGLQRGAEHDLE